MYARRLDFFFIALAHSLRIAQVRFRNANAWVSQRPGWFGFASQYRTHRHGSLQLLATHSPRGLAVGTAFLKSSMHVALLDELQRQRSNATSASSQSTLFWQSHNASIHLSATHMLQASDILL